MRASRFLVRFLIPACAVALLAGCGGGAGGKSEASVTVPTRQITVTVNDDGGRLVYSDAAFSVANPPDEGLAVLIESDSPLIQNAQIFQDTDSQGRLRLQLYADDTADVGIHEVPVRLSFCRDDTCEKHLQGSPVSLTFLYDIRPEDRKVTVELVAPPLAAGVLSDTNGPTVSGFIRVLNPPAEGLHLGLEGEGGNTRVIDTATLSATSDGYRVDFQLARPALLGIGDFNATHSFSVCFDAQCSERRFDVREPEDMHVAYTVTAVPIQPVRRFEMQVFDLAWDALHNRILLARGISGGGTNLAALDPQTGTVMQTPGGSSPLKSLTISPDGEFVVAAEARAPWIQRFRTSDLTNVETIYPRFESGTSIYVAQIQYGPAGQLGMITGRASQPSFDLRIMDGNVARPDTFENANIKSFAWDPDGTRIYAYSITEGLFVLGVSETGVKQIEIDASVQYLFDRITYSEGRLFSSGGKVVDLASRSSVASLGFERDADSDRLDVAIDEQLRRVYVLHTLDTDQPGDSRITAYDLDSLEKQSAIVLHQVNAPTRMIRWGERGLALSNGIGDLYLLEGGVVDGTDPSP
ncbi:MAG: hypothetical protein ACT4PZ_23390 [Panacagrimonas sp.]